jgi:YjbE family integral membrane protein
VDFLLQDMLHAPFWIAVLQIIGVNIILSGDNAVVIAMACMTLPPRQRLWGMILGAGVAVLLRIVFTVIIATAMEYPFIRLVGGLLLFWVAVKLVIEDADGSDDEVKAAENLWRAVITVTIADIVMSLDNVIAIAGTAESAARQVDLAHASAIKTTLIIIGLATSIPLIIAGSAVLMALLERFRVLVWGGGALLGWIAGEVMTADPVIGQVIGTGPAHFVADWGARVGAVFVVSLGLWLVRRHRSLAAEEVWSFVAVLVWVAAEVVIAGNFPETEVAKAWAARVLLFLLLASDYVVLRHGPVVIESMVIESKTLIVERERDAREPERVLERERERDRV